MLTTLAGGRLEGPFAEIDEAFLSIGVEAEPDHRSDVHAEFLGSLDVHNCLVRIGRICQATCNKMNTVLCRVLTAQCSFEHRWLLAGPDPQVGSGDVPGDRSVKSGHRFHGSHIGQPGKLGSDCRVVADGGPERRIVEAGEELNI